MQVGPLQSQHSCGPSGLQPRPSQQAAEVQQRNAAAGSSNTPELCNDAIGSAGGNSPQQEKKLFPIFRPKAERKVLYIIRHGESEFNAATNTGKGFSDPQIYDPKLTAKGQTQVSCCCMHLVSRGYVNYMCLNVIICNSCFRQKAVLLCPSAAAAFHYLSQCWTPTDCAHVTCTSRTHTCRA